MLPPCLVIHAVVMDGQKEDVKRIRMLAAPNQQVLDFARAEAECDGVGSGVRPPSLLLG